MERFLVNVKWLDVYVSEGRINCLGVQFSQC